MLPPRSVSVVYGTRPEAIKLAPLVALLGPAAELVHTGQHYDDALGRAVAVDLGLPEPDVRLDVGGQPRGRQIGVATAALADHLAGRGRVVVVQGDTNAGVAGALAANATGCPLVHVEAGLRSFDRAMPEEHNRVLIDHLADVCAAPTAASAANLRAEGIAEARIAVTGNTIVEAVAALRPAPDEAAAHLRDLDLDGGPYVLATLHRPENVDEPEAMRAILAALAAAAARTGRAVVLPLHPRTLDRIEAFGLSGLLEPLRVLGPLAPRRFLAVAAAAELWLSDSGGLQEEATILGRPILVLRRSTERPEALGTFAELVERADLEHAVVEASPGPRTTSPPSPARSATGSPHAGSSTSSPSWLVRCATVP